MRVLYLYGMAPQSTQCAVINSMLTLGSEQRRQKVSAKKEKDKKTAGTHTPTRSTQQKQWKR